jgi:molybdopterin-guanine dinucleotide biosynthesis protein A
MRADSALILAGGKSTRMGYDKKGLELNGASVLERLVVELGSLFSEVIISSNKPVMCGNVRVVSDGIGAGPLAGIYRGLEVCGSDYLYVTACDMPFLSAEYIRYIRGIVTAEGSADACVFRRSDGLYEPFNSFFGKSCLEPMRAALLRGEYKISLLLEALRLRVVEPEVAEKYPAPMFFNINYQEDLARAELMQAEK